MSLDVEQKDGIELDDIVDDEIYYRSFFGEKQADYYIERLRRIENGEVALFNVFAFFFSSLWMAYRKMYLELLILLLILMLTEVFWYFVFGIDNSGFDKITNLLWSLVIGGFANYFYMKKARRTVTKAKETYTSLNDRLDYIKRIGGTSILSLSLFILFFIVLVLLVLFLEDYAMNSYY